MKRWLAMLAITLMLCGCGSENRELSRGLAFREKLLASQGCNFTAAITADYADAVHSFTLDCHMDSTGAVAFTVTAPESIAGITGSLSAQGGKLTFDGKALAFDMLAEETVSPVSGPWVLMQALRGGYLRACGMDGENLRMTCDASYDEDALQVDIWLDAADAPIRGEVLWEGRRVLSMDVSNFTFR